MTTRESDMVVDFRPESTASSFCTGPLQAGRDIVADTHSLTKTVYSERVKCSLARLNQSVERFEQVLSKYSSTTSNHVWENISVSNILDCAMKETDIFTRTTAIGQALTLSLTNRISERDDLNSSVKRIGSFISRLTPLIKILLEVGGTAAQVYDN